MNSTRPMGKFDKQEIEPNGDKELLDREIEACRWTKEELRSRDLHYRILVETMNDGLVIRDENGVITYANQSCCDMLGYAKEEIVGKQVSDFLDDENARIVQDHTSKRQKGSKEIYELTLRGKHGRKTDVIVAPKPIFDSEQRFKGSFGVLTDVTRLKQAEKELRVSEQKLRFLSFHLLQAQEEEDQRISRELHDELGQDLAVLKYQIRFILRKLRTDQSIIKESCDDALGHLDRIMDKVRRISGGLYPAGVKHFGLTAALKNMVETFAKHSQTQFSFEVENIDHIFSAEIQANLYRLFREALTNTARHASATSVCLGIVRKDDQLSCWLEDNGKGFDVLRAMSGVSLDQGIGLVTMQERARMLGGSLEIKSQQGAGTRISLMVPLQNRGVP